MRERLAICGGPRAVPEGTVKPWPPIDDVDRQMVLAALESQKFVFGPHYKTFQEEFAAWNGNRFAILTNSGTGALHMAVAACDVAAGDEVIVPAYSWSSSATCVLHHNAIPVFTDIDWETMNIDPAQIEAAITPRTRAIIAVHLHGLAADMDSILGIAERHGLKVIEDCCQSHGALYHGRKVGTMGHCAAFSFNQNKSLTSGEGGMFVTDDEAAWRKAQQLWSFGETRAPDQSRDYHAYALGWMYRASDLTAAFGRAQLSKLDRYLADQQANALRLTECLQDVPGLLLPSTPEGYGHTFYNYTVRFDMDSLGHAADAAEYRNRLVKAMQAEGVETGLWQTWPLPAMTVFQARNAYGKGCPWSCLHAAPVDYRLERFPMAQQHCDWHTGMTYPLRTPNGPDVAEAMARGIRKVMENRDQLEGTSP